MKHFFEAFEEATPGAKWQAHFEKHWPAYRRWFLAEGDDARPSYHASLKMLQRFMPELAPTYKHLCELGGGGDVAARFLASYRPPPYLSGCSQAVWPGDDHILVRNYDYSPQAFEGVIMCTRWNTRRVIAMSDCLWGVVDGMNDDGLVVSLAFGGRRVVGDGFGAPLLLRYILEFCETTLEAVDVLRRVPTHMAYNVTVLDREGNFRTAFLSPDRDPVVRQLPAVTNHQGRIEWQQHARATASLERERFLFFRLADSEETEAGLVAAFLRSPLFSTGYRNGFGTLYTALYRPATGEVELLWPNSAPWKHSFERFREGTYPIGYAASAGRFHQDAL